MKFDSDEFARTDFAEKVTGSAIYAADVSFPRTLFGVIVRAERPHALIEDIVMPDAAKRPEVRAVLTAQDCRRFDYFFGHHFRDHPALADDRVRYVGEPVAVVIATSELVAREVAREIVVEYSDLDELMDIEASLAAHVPLLHRWNDGQVVTVGPCVPGRSDTNEACTYSMEWGDADRALAQAYRTIESEVDFPGLYAYAMEPYVAQARFVGGRLEVISCAQHPFQVQRELARIFQLDLCHVRVQVPYIGGGFGSKSYTKLEPLAALCSYAVDGAPVRLALSIEESMLTTRADASRVSVVTGVDREGNLVARKADIFLDTGAYLDNSPEVLKKTAHSVIGPYRCDHVAVNATAVYTTTPPASSYRGFGAYHAGVASESNLDQCAIELGMDPVDVRLNNMVRRGEILIPGSRRVDADLISSLKQLRTHMPKRQRGEALRGIGYGCGLSAGGAIPTATCIVRLLADGSVVVLCSSVEMGQGTRTLIANIVAQELKIERSRVFVHSPDTDATPAQWSTGASRTAALAGLSLVRACDDIKAQLRSVCSAFLHVSEQDIDVSEGRLKLSDGRTVTYSDVIQQKFSGRSIGEFIGVGHVGQVGDVDPLPAYWEVAMAAAEVCVDPETGRIAVERVVMVSDVGQAVVSGGVEAQQFGGALQAIGGVLTEELHYESGELSNGNLIDYRVPRISDIPESIESLLIENADGLGDLGIKGVGESAASVVGTAVYSAVCQAIGTWSLRLPLRPDRVWQVINRSRDASVN